MFHVTVPTSRLFLVALVVLAGTACESLPEASLRQNDMGVSLDIRDDSLFIAFDNPAPIPTRVRISSSMPDLDERVASNVVVGPSMEAVFSYHIVGVDTSRVRASLSMTTSLGSLDVPVRPVPLAWPFPAGRSYTIIQGYQGSFSHTSSYSRHALDFNLAKGDTVSAADDGFVVGVIEGYDVGGNDPKYRPYANFITLYHPHSGLMTQYVHLAPEGSFVAVGDTVSRGQPIGLAGLTGFTSVQHLHFNVLAPDSTDGIVSYRITFEDGTEGAALQRGDRVGH